MTTEKRMRRKYTEVFKREAMALVAEQGYRLTEAARSLDIGEKLLHRRKHEFEQEASGAD